MFGAVLDRKQVDYKKASIKESRNIDIFPKGLVHGFGQKFELSSSILSSSILFI